MCRFMKFLWILSLRLSFVYHTVYPDTESDEGASTDAKNNQERRKGGHDGSAQQWKEMMLNAISEREKAENEKQVCKI